MIGVLFTKISKIILSSTTALALALAVGNTPQANAAKTDHINVNESDLTENDEISAMIDWSGNVYLTRNVYSNVIGSNNIFTDSPTITNRAGNPGTVVFRIVDGKGNIIAKSGYVDPGTSVKLGPIPAFSGTYTIQASAEVTGTYNIAVD
ncbi:hypothetical protein [Sporosarcina sp. ITBMC105]